jgi:glycyl-tRNA synthetase beta chain
MVPESDVGAILALADRMDNIVSFFSIGIKPTGSEDPFALRRAALGIIAILEERGYDLTIKHLLEVAVANIAQVPGAKYAGGEMLGFFEQRLEPLLAGQGFDYDLVQSVLPLSIEVPLKEVYGRLEALRKFKVNSEYNAFLAAVKRVRNILAPLLKSGEENPPVNEGLFREDEEKELHNKLKSVKSLKELQGKVSYAEAIQEMLVLIEPINDFFDKVLVMDKDEAVRNNRLGLLRDIWDMASSVADFSKLQESGAESGSGDS